MAWPRPVPTVGDRTSADERAADPTGWAFADADVDVLHRVIEARRDVRRFRPDAVPHPLLDRLLAAAHAAPSVGHSQPWRFVVVTDAVTRQRAATMADGQRLAQAAALDGDSGRHLLDLDLEGIREAPVGIVVCCDRRTPAAGVLGRATFADADMWSCACAIENLWLAARAAGLGLGWVTLFRPGDLLGLVGAPAGVETLGWLCVGWPDERPPAPGLERRGWSRRMPVGDVVFDGSWPAADAAPPVARALAGGGRTDGGVGGGHVDGAAAGPMPGVEPTRPSRLVGARDAADRLLTPPGSLGALDRAVDRVVALRHGGATVGSLVVAAADHPVVAHGVSAYEQRVTRDVARAALAGTSVGAVAARGAGLVVVVVDAGVAGGPLAGAVALRPVDPQGDLVVLDALSARDVTRLVDGGRQLGADLAAAGPVALGEIGVGNTTVAAALAAALLDLDAGGAIGLGAGADRSVLDAKRVAVAAALARLRDPAGAPGGAGADPWRVLAAVGGGEMAVLTGVVLGVAAAGGVVVLDGLATSVAALVAVRLRPGVAAHLVAGQRSREAAHGPVLEALGLEPLLDLRIRAGEGAGAALATGLLLSGLRIRREAARTDR